MGKGKQRKYLPQASALFPACTREGTLLKTDLNHGKGGGSWEIGSVSKVLAV